ncbi:MAG: L,D-transpeptidase [Hyphomicrobiaceae bacterium]
MYLRLLSAHRTTGVLEAGTLRLPCAVGGGGVSALKREGDGATPAGRFDLVEVRYRADRVRRPASPFPTRPSARRDGWCDAAGDRSYNRPVRLPYRASAESMWRDDGVYDVVVVLSHNQRPRKQGAGSAVFMHLARPEFAPTAGCIALRQRDLLLLLSRLSRRARIVTTAPRRRIAAGQNGTSPMTAVRSMRRRSG